MSTYKIYIIRHGITQANLDGTYCGTTDLPLCAEGFARLAGLAGKYEYPYPDVVYTSPLLRARQTANVLFPDYEHFVKDGLREASFGVYEGRRFSDLSDDADFQKWVSFGSEVTPEGAEPHEKFNRRCVETFVEIVGELMKSGTHSAAVVTHASVIANVLANIAYPKKNAYDWQCYAGCGYTVLADPILFCREPVVEVIDVVPADLDF